MAALLSDSNDSVMPYRAVTSIIWGAPDMGMVRCMMQRQRWPLTAFLLKPMTSPLSHRCCWAAACWSARPPPSASAATHAQGHEHLQEVHSTLWLQLGNVSILRFMPRCIAAAKSQSHLILGAVCACISHLQHLQHTGRGFAGAKQHVR